MSDPPPEPATDEDANHLHLLGIFHYVTGGFALLGGFCPSLHVVMGVLVLVGAFPTDNQGEAPPRVFGLVVIVMAVAIMLAAWALGAVILCTARYLHKRQHFTFCQVMAAIECVFMPLGTVLGIFTLIVLNRPTVRQAFGAARQPKRLHRSA
jgi:hypothetical protein